LRMTLVDAQAKALPGRSWLKCRPVSVGAFAGQNVVQNEHFESLVDTNDAWISKRTGIRRRHVIKAGSSLRELAALSAKDALNQANMSPTEIDLVVLATSSPDDLFGDAASVCSAIGAINAVGFDLTAACSGFLYSLVTASQFLHSGGFKKALVIGADALTRFLDWKDRGSCILFGDGAGAMVVEAVDDEKESGLLGYSLKSDGSGYCNLKLPFVSDFRELENKEKTVVDQGNYGKMFMNGAEVYVFAVNRVPGIIAEAVSNAGLAMADIDHILLHQANVRIMESVAKELKVAKEKLIVNLDEYGNTSAASIPLALSEAVKKGIVKKGDTIAVAGFGAGLNWGAAVIRW
jgi:3-oxoacyl-[acyl-carrier-protein] synthase-3